MKLHPILLLPICIIIGLILLFILLSITPIKATEDRAVQCNYCHTKLGITVDDPDCELCHDVVRDTLTHQARVCHVCHNITDANSYHIAHNISCEICHPTGEIPPKIYSECLSCHTSIHNIHNNCVMCHPTNTNGTSTPKIYKPFSIYESILKILKGLKWIR